jgi:hypothetical protein
MTKPAFSKSLLVLVSSLALVCAPRPASARHDGRPKGGGGSHSGNSHGGGSFHGGGHSNFKSGGHSYSAPRAYRGSRGGSQAYSSHLGGGFRNNTRANGGFSARSGSFSARQPGSFAGNFSRSANSVNRGFGSSSGTRNFGGFGSSQSVAQGSRASTGRWQSFGNLGGRSVLASAHTSGNLSGFGWRPFGNASRFSGAEIHSGSPTRVRTNSQWRSFGNSTGAVSSARNNSGFSSFGTDRTSAARFHSLNPDFSSRFSGIGFGPAHSSSFSSFSSNRSFGELGESRFGASGFGRSAFSGESFNGSGFGAGVSLIPNLLGGFLNLGTTLFAGPGALAANALTFAVQAFVSAIASSGSDQGGFEGGAGFGPSGFGENFGFAAAPVLPACGPVAPLWAPVPVPGAYCPPAPYAYQPYGWGSIGYLSGPRIGFGLYR